MDALENYFNTTDQFKDAISKLRALLLKTELKETYKWNAPVYTINGKNVVGLGRFKNHFGIWFFQGALLNDPKSQLHNAQEGKTKALRQLRFYKEEDIVEATVLGFLKEAIANQKNGLEIKSERTTSKLDIPKELESALEQDQQLKKCFENLTPGRQKDFAKHIFEAKQEKTRLRRLNKILPLIRDGVGLYDKYKNC
ncbi:YdeI/OmpD-associated family protein [Leeuwenhoekiella aequorea]|uniref:YdeI/OmpD-associated family protein n=1 Tax=Leeuwenhoekiella aequorea TaxID=283736 RepID=UPI00352BF8B6